MADPKHEDYDLIPENVIDNTIVADSNSVRVLLSGQFSDACRKWVLGKDIDLGGDSPPKIEGQSVECFLGRGLKQHAVAHYNLQTVLTFDTFPGNRSLFLASLAGGFNVPFVFEPFYEFEVFNGDNSSDWLLSADNYGTFARIFGPAQYLGEFLPGGTCTNLRHNVRIVQFVRF